MLAPRALYRHILRAHRAVLPPDLRFVGDGYVREEFRKHRKAEAKFVGPFMRSWSEYLSTLEEQRAQALEGAVLGRDLAATELDALTESQRKQLSLLKRESTRPLRGRDQQ